MDEEIYRLYGLSLEFNREEEIEGVDNLIYHPINAASELDNEVTFVTNPDVPDINKACESLVSCDIYYNLDWWYVARIEGLDCAYLEDDRNDPCFGSRACACDNGYFWVSSEMPE